MSRGNEIDGTRSEEIRVAPDRSESQALAAHLRRLVSEITPILERDPYRALNRARRSAGWVLRELLRQASGSDPGNLRYRQLYDQVVAQDLIPRRIQIQFRAIETFGTAEDHSDSGLSQSDVLPCLHALNIIVQWYLEDHLGTEEKVTFLPGSDPGSTTSGSRSRVSHDGPSGRSHLGRRREQPPWRSAARHPRPRRWLVLLALTSATVVGLFLVQLHENRVAAGRRVGISLDLTTDHLRISGIAPEGPAQVAGLRTGDVLIAVDGMLLGRIEDYDVAAAEFNPESDVTFLVSRQGKLHEITLTPGVPVDLLSPMIAGFVMTCCLALAVMTIYRSPRDLRGRLLGIFLFLVALELALPTVLIGNVTLDMVTSALFLLMTGAQIAVHLHLASVIPERQKWLAGRGYVVSLYYVLGLGFGSIAAATHLIDWASNRSVLPWSLSQLNAVLNEVGLPLWAAAIVILLGMPALRYPEAQGRLQARIVLLGFLPWSIYTFVVWILDRIGKTLPAWLDPFFPLIVLCFPVAIWAVMEQQARNHRKILLTLSQEIRRLDSIEEISRLITDDLDAAFHPVCTYIFFLKEQTDELALGHSTGAQLEVENVPPHFELLELAAASDDALVYPEDLREILPEEETRWLERLAIQVIVPLNDSRRGLVGLLLLGAKRSEEAYSERDFKLLHSLAGQVALSFENLGLQSRLHEKTRAQREVLARLQGQDINLVKECPVCGACFDSDVENCIHDGSELTLSVPVERTIGDRYRLDKVLGKGGIGSVYKALDLRLNRRVAVKVLLGSVLDKPHVQLRFEREAHIIAQLNHPNIVTVYDYGQTAVGNAFIVLELLEGISLRKLLRRSGPVPPAKIAVWLEPILEGLKAAHRMGVVHRDLKPGNVLIGRNLRGEDVVKLLDFGIAKIKTGGAQARNLTVPGVVLGTVGYMAPEQVLGDEVDERADIYSIGVLVNEALLGRRPFKGGTPMEVLRSVSRASIEMPLEAPELARISKIVRRCLKRDPADRYSSVDELQKVLLPALRTSPAVHGLRPRSPHPVSRDRTEEI